MKDLNKPGEHRAEEYGSRKEVITLDRAIIDSICAFVADGGAATRWCNVNQVSYSGFLEAIRANSRYERLYLQALKDREEWLKEELLQLMKDMMTFDPRDAYDNNGNILPMSDLPANVAKMIKKSRTIKQQNGTKNPDIVDALEYYDKQKAIDQLGKHLQMFVERVDHNHTITLEETIVRSYERDKPKPLDDVDDSSDQGK